MAFVRRRGNNTTLIETYREGDKIGQRIIANLYGQNSVEEALREFDRQIVEHQRWLQRIDASHREPLVFFTVDGQRISEQPKWLCCVNLLRAQFSYPREFLGGQ